VVTALSYLDHYQPKKRKCQLTHCTRVVMWDRWTDVALLIASAIRSEYASVDTTAMFFSWNSTFSLNTFHAVLCIRAKYIFITNNIFYLDLKKS
jgi:hypothetical protein